MDILLQQYHFQVHYHLQNGFIQYSSWSTVQIHVPTVNTKLTDYPNSVFEF